MQCSYGINIGCSGDKSFLLDFLSSFTTRGCPGDLGRTFHVFQIPLGLVEHGTLNYMFCPYGGDIMCASLGSPPLAEGV